MKNNIALIVIVALLVGGAIGFYGGTKYQSNKLSSSNIQFNGGRFAGGGNGTRRGNGGAVVGSILSVDSSSITVKLNDGSSKIVLLTDSTSLNKASQAAKSDLTAGERVAVFGTANSDGSVTAQSVQLNPMFRGMEATPSPTMTAH